MKWYKLTLLGIAALLLTMAQPLRVGAAAPVNVELIIDASGSMAARMEGKTKLDIAKDVLMGLVADLPSDAQVAVRAYGHHRKEDCDDLELLAPFGPQEPSRFAGKVKALKPVGMTPIAGSLDVAGRDFAGREGQHNIILLVSDGKETCKRDPCAVAKRLRQSGVQVEINVIGFNVTPEERKQLECIAEEGGGKYYNATNAKEFRVAAAEVKQQVAQATPAAEPPKSATPAAAPATPTEVNLLAQDQGGQAIIVPQDGWQQVLSGGGVRVLVGEEAVFAFKDEKPATISKFSVLITQTDPQNPKTIELLVADDSPMGTFRSVGKFSLVNVKVRSGWQEFSFPETTAKYVKIKALEFYQPGGCYYQSYNPACVLPQVRLMGKLVE